jgi:hypothetical protein
MSILNSLSLHPSSSSSAALFGGVYRIPPQYEHALADGELQAKIEDFIDFIKPTALSEERYGL